MDRAGQIYRHADRDEVGERERETDTGTELPTHRPLACPHVDVGSRQPIEYLLGSSRSAQRIADPQADATLRLVHPARHRGRAVVRLHRGAATGSPSWLAGGPAPPLRRLAPSAPVRRQRTRRRRRH